jgi:hypothetical protein
VSREKLTLRVTLNGTDANPWHRFGLKLNPFPQIARAELTGAMRQLASLDGDPIRDEADLRARLRGWSEEFIEACLANFKPGKRTRFVVSFPGSRGEASA